MTKLDAGLMTSLPASDPGSAAVWGSKRINPRPQSCLCLTWSGYRFKRRRRRKEQPIRSKSKRAVMNEFETVKKFLVSTEIGLKRFDKCSFKSREVERSTSSGKDREFGVTVLAGTARVFQEMLSNNRVMGGDLRSAAFLAAQERLE